MEGRLLIVNADDFGISEGVNRGIVDAHERGILTSTTLMANMPAFEHAVEMWREHPTLGVGVHLNLTSGNPVLPPDRIPALVSQSGRLLPIGTVLRLLTLDRIPLDQVQAEFAAQIEQAIAAGLAPTHLDSHHHVHMHPRLHLTVIRLAQRYGIRAARATAEMGPLETIGNVRMLLQDDEPAALPDGRLQQPLGVGDGTIRIQAPVEATPAQTAELNLEGRSSAVETPRALYVKSLALSMLGVLFRWRARRAGLAVPGHFRGLLLGIAFTAEQLRPVLESLPTGSTELMTHPGYPDDALRQRTSFSTGRDSELAALLDPASRAGLERSGVRLGSFTAL